MEEKKIKKLQLENYSKIFFQIGLVLSLFIIHNLLEIKKFDRKTAKINQVFTMTSESDYDVEIPIIKLKTYNPAMSKTPPPPSLEKIEIVEDTKEIIENIIGTTETDESDVINLSTDTANGEAISSIIEVKEDEEIIEDVPFVLIENVPIYPGCKGNNKQLRSCFSKKIAQYFSENFDKNLAKDLGLEQGKKRILLLFRIDTKGNVIDVKARAPHPVLQEEVIKIINSLPKMIPGKQRDIPVTVSYSIPITFEVIY
jgi:protein TonB|tara:strand:+ start:766 stop:1533 length:768 start_codon:yes stop_codon:yes gene_type:complete